MTITRMQLLQLEWSAEWAAAKPLNESTSVVYRIMVPPTDILELIAEIERHRQINAEGCKPDLINPPHQSVAALREDIERGKRVQLAMALDLSAIAQALGIPPDEQQGGSAECIAAIQKLQAKLEHHDA